MLRVQLLKRTSHFFRKYPALMQIPYYAYRFFQPKFTIGVIGVVINHHGKILLVEHVFHPYHPIGLPGGWVNRNEDPQKAIIRELHEELSLTVTPQAIIHSERTQYNHLDIAYLCRPLSDVGDLSFELLGYDWYELDQIPHLHAFHRQAIVNASQLTNKFDA